MKSAFIKPFTATLVATLAAIGVWGATQINSDTTIDSSASGEYWPMSPCTITFSSAFDETTLGALSFGNGMDLPVIFRSQDGSENLGAKFNGNVWMGGGQGNGWWQVVSGKYEVPWASKRAVYIAQNANSKAKIEIQGGSFSVGCDTWVGSRVK